MIDFNPNHFRINQLAVEAIRLKGAIWKAEEAPTLPEEIFVSGIGDPDTSILIGDNVRNAEAVARFIVEQPLPGPVTIQVRPFLARPAVGFNRDCREMFPDLCSKIILMCELAQNNLLLI